MSHLSTLYTILFFIYSLFNLSIGDLETSTVSLTTDPDISIQIKIDTDTNTVAMTIQGPSDRWFGIGFGVAMAGTYTIISDESGQVFEQILGEYNGKGQRTSTVNINVCSNIVEASERIITLILPMSTEYSTFPNEATNIQVIAGYGPTTGNYYEFETAQGMDGRTESHDTAPQITFMDTSEVIMPGCTHISTTGAIESTIGTINTADTATTIGTIQSTIDAITSTIGTIMSTSATDTTADISSTIGTINTADTTTIGTIMPTSATDTTTIGTTNNDTTTTTSRPETTMESTQIYTTSSSDIWSTIGTTHEGNANRILNGIYIGFIMCLSLYLVV